MAEWWGGLGGQDGSKQRALLVPRLFFQHFTDTSYLVELATAVNLWHFWSASCRSLSPVSHTSTSSASIRACGGRAWERRCIGGSSRRRSGAARGGSSALPALATRRHWASIWAWGSSSNLGTPRSTAVSGCTATTTARVWTASSLPANSAKATNSDESEQAEYQIYLLSKSI